jgi:hypothetical protein
MLCHATHVIPALVLACCLSVPRAQCAPAVVPGAGVPGTDGPVDVTRQWDPDGTGPLGTHIVIGGSFTKLVDRRARGIGMYDPTSGSWRELGDVAGSVTALAVRANGNLLIGGSFATIYGASFANVAEFDGTSWLPLGSGIAVQGSIGATIYAMAGLPNGDVVVSGLIPNIQGLPIGGLARFDGANWHAMGTFLLGPGAVLPPRSLCVLPNGDLVAGGNFDRIGTLVVNGLARWDGTAWSAFGTGLFKANGLAGAWAMDAAPNGDLVVAGVFDSVAGVAAANVARWSGTSWSALGNGVSGMPACVRALPGGAIVLAGNLAPAPGLNAPSALWNGANWQLLGFGSPGVMMTIEPLPGGGFLGGGNFEDVAGQYGRGLARWNTASWHPVASGTVGTARCVLNLRDGGTFVGGDLARIDGIASPGAARHDGSGWNAMPAIAVHAAAEMADGSLFAVVQTSPATSASVDVCRWDGLGWTALPGTDSVLTLLAEPGGTLLIGGYFGFVGGNAIRGIARWNGTAWSVVIPGFTGSVSALALLRDGRLALAGSLAISGVALGNIGVWDGVSLQPLGSLTHVPRRLAVGPNGDLFACGIFGFSGVSISPRVARWNGTAWSDLNAAWTTTAQFPRALAALPNGDVLVGGTFASAGGVAVNNLARWDGASWHAYGTGADDTIEDLHAAPDGRIAIAGAFVRIDNVTSAAVARVAPACAGMLLEYGVACAQGSGQLQLAAEPAWLGGALNSRASNLPATALALAVYGFQPLQLNLATVLPIAGTNCFLHAAPDYVAAAVAVAGASSHHLPVPRITALLGATVFHQVLSLELDAMGAPVTLGGTGAVAASLGAMW